MQRASNLASKLARKLALTDSMPKYYAVARGREGPKVYRSWDETSRFPGAVHKSFTSIEQAETWLASSISLQAAAAPAPQPSSRPTDSSFRSQKPYSRTARSKFGNPPTQVPTAADASSSNVVASPSKVLLSDEQQAHLIVDEISMVDGALFDKLEEMARILRGNDSPVWWHTTRSKDQAFVNLLNAMRFGKIGDLKAFTALARPVEYTDGIQPTELLSRREEVERVNNQRLAQLPGNCETYAALDVPGWNANKNEPITREQMEKLLDRLVVPKMIGLKIGAQVMLVKNLAQGRLVNGSLGQVIGFSTARDAISRHVEIANPENNSKNNQPPPGLESVRLWPLVKFSHGEELLMVPQEFTINNADGDMEARRDQVPLILAWALSVHKSQGQTLERVKVDLKQTFEKGQAYVAVSRATTMEHLQILNFHPSKVSAHPRVLQWYAEFEEADRNRRVEEEMDWDEAMDAYYNN
ncbi:ATP-dependent DNA helicase PIF1 [Mycena venus]|uniref:ATP-dependent DNA helicase PIF1 n=1 Tax=Mycena venus TaxID=2733690 RepID=A0A8H7CLQ5_9AGAR|nr:ATP-dependent DNA helicase PIF1 [Mycena venus]